MNLLIAAMTIDSYSNREHRDRIIRRGTRTISRIPVSATPLRTQKSLFNCLRLAYVAPKDFRKRMVFLCEDDLTVPVGKFTWDLPRIALSLHLTEEDVRAYFTDGRRVSFLLERRIAYEVLQGSLASSEGAGYDVLDRNGNKWEVRSISRGGIYFCPSYMVGSGRSFERQGFVDKLDEIAGYVVSDIEGFPVVPYWIIDVEVVRRWWEAGFLGKTTKVSRQKALALLKRL